MLNHRNPYPITQSKNRVIPVLEEDLGKIIGSDPVVGMNIVKSLNAGTRSAITGHNAFSAEGFRSYRGPIEMVLNQNADPSAKAAVDEIFGNTLGLSNEIAKAIRDDGNYFTSGLPSANRKFKELLAGRRVSAKSYDGAESNEYEIAKAVLDVGSQTNYANVTGGQTLGYFSLDTNLARSTVRQRSFSLLQSLKKSRATQVVDFWASISDTGGGVVGTAFQGFGNVSTGVLTTNVGNYQMLNVQHKLLVDGRAMTTALAAQDSFVDIASNETVNAGLNVLSSADWATYHGDATLYPNQFNGLSAIIPAYNKYSYQQFANAYTTQYGWSPAQALYALIFSAAGDITAYGKYGVITHAYMSPEAMASLQQLITTTINNVVQLDIKALENTGLTLNGDLVGIRTSFGNIAFVRDLFINARDIPVQGSVYASKATTVNPTNPASVAVAVVSSAANSGWSAAYTTSPSYVYAVASVDSSMNESVLTYSPVETAIGLNGAVNITISPPAANDAYAFRVFRSGNGYALTGSANLPGAFRYIGTVLANGSTPVVFQDLNLAIPGSETIYLLDLLEEDNAIDWRELLPMSKIELFAQSLYMPWAIVMIGTLRVRIPQFHGLIYGYVPDSTTFDPLLPNLGNL